MGSTKSTDKNEMGVREVRVQGTATTGNSDKFQFIRPMKIALHFVAATAGAFNADIQASNDGTNFVDLPTTVRGTTNSLKSVPRDGLGFKYYRISHTGGVATSDFTCIIAAIESR
jgi:hypothetical protein